MSDGREPSSDRTARDLARHILPSSGTMIGICTTLVGLVKIMEGRTGPSNVDEYGALIGVVFLGSAILSYLSIRMAGRARFSRRCETVADALFLVGLFSIVALAALFTFETV